MEGGHAGTAAHDAFLSPRLCAPRLKQGHCLVRIIGASNIRGVGLPLNLNAGSSKLPPTKDAISTKSTSSQAAEGEAWASSAREVELSRIGSICLVED